MAVTVNGREFSDATLGRIYDALDSGGTRAEVRRIVRDAQGRGVSNETIASLRSAHLQLRRSQGFALAPGARRNLPRHPDGRLLTPGELAKRGGKAARLVLGQRHRPAPPRLPGQQYQQVVEINLFDPNGRFIGRDIKVFDVGPGAPSVAAQVRDAQRGRGDSPKPGDRIPGRGYEVLATLAVDPSGARIPTPGINLLHPNER